jgi:hypothetical protein
MLGLMCMCESEASFTLCLQDGPLQVRLHKLAKPSELPQHFAFRRSSRRRYGAARHVIYMVWLYHSRIPVRRRGGHFTWFYLLPHRLEEVGNISISYVLKTGK